MKLLAKYSLLITLCLGACISDTSKTISIKDVLGKGLTAVDYSFGDEHIRAVQDQVLRGEYEEMRENCTTKTSDWLTQMVDALALNIPEEYLQNWLAKAKEKELPTLVLGAYYSHKAWVVRGYSYANDIGEEEILSFDDYQDKAIELLTTIQENKTLLVDAAARLIRIYMGKSNMELVEHYFLQCQELDRNHLWSYIHYSEAVQPKWLGSLEALEKFMIELPNRQLIQQIIALKMMNDSFLANQNYVDKESSDLKQIASRLLQKINQEVDESTPSTVQKYVLYNYIAFLSDEIGNQQLLEKYGKRMKNNYTLYPAGIVQE
ncbi:MAG: hypothetical protein ACRBFS_25575 [Aureispira sp.]